jgi:hypothetical protein
VTKKKERRRRAKEVRRRTGVSIPVAAELVKHGPDVFARTSKTAEEAMRAVEFVRCGDVCACLEAQDIVGPRGRMPLREAWL